MTRWVIFRVTLTTPRAPRLNSARSLSPGRTNLKARKRPKTLRNLSEARWHMLTASWSTSRSPKIRGYAPRMIRSCTPSARPQVGSPAITLSCRQPNKTTRRSPSLSGQISSTSATLGPPVSTKDHLPRALRLQQPCSRSLTCSSRSLTGSRGHATRASQSTVGPTGCRRRLKSSGKPSLKKSTRTISPRTRTSSTNSSPCRRHLSPSLAYYLPTSRKGLRPSYQRLLSPLTPSMRSQLVMAILPEGPILTKFAAPD